MQRLQYCLQEILRYLTDLGQSLFHVSTLTLTEWYKLDVRQNVCNNYGILWL